MLVSVRISFGKRHKDGSNLSDNPYAAIRINTCFVVELDELRSTSFYVGIAGVGNGSPLTAHGEPLTAHGEPLTAHGEPLTAHS